MKTCKQCGSEFEKRCRKCAKESLQRWRDKQRQAGIPTGRRGPEQKKYNEKFQSTLKGRMMKLIIHAKARTKDHRTPGGQRFATFDIDRQHLLDLWEEQNGKCALSGLPMDFDKTSLKCASIDRKIQSVGYMKGNVQLVCRFANLAKHTHSDEEIKEVFRQLREGYIGGGMDTERAGM